MIAASGKTLQQHFVCEPFFCLRSHIMSCPIVCSINVQRFFFQFKILMVKIRIIEIVCFSSNCLFSQFSYSVFMWKWWPESCQSPWVMFSLTREEQRTAKGHTDDKEIQVLFPTGKVCGATGNMSNYWIEMFGDKGIHI